VDKGGQHHMDSAMIQPEAQSEALKEEFGPISRVLGQRYFDGIRFPPEAEDELRALHAKGFVVHVMRTTAWVNFLYLAWAMVRRALPPVRAVVIGAVHISQAFAPLARVTGLDVTIVDPRTAFATPERFPDVPVLAEWPDAALARLGLDRYTALLALTHDPKIDDPALDAALRSPAFYVGALGSKKTHARRVERLAGAGFGEGDIARIHAPIGLDIGAVSPAEIALSILAEIVATLRADRRRSP